MSCVVRKNWPKNFAMLGALFCVVPALASQPPKTEHPYFNSFYTPGPLEKWLIAEIQPAPQGPLEGTGGSQQLNLEAPQIDAKKDESLNIGPANNLNFGGTLDMRFYFPRIGGPTDQHMGFGNFDIHVSELFLTTNIGDHISLLAEQLLVTDPMGSTVGQDHGFVYAIFSSIPGLPENMAIKVGRTRFKFGIDAKLDSPANILHSPVYKTLGVITDKGIEFSGYISSLEWTLGVANGVDAVEKTVTSTDGQQAQVMMDARNGSKPVYARLAYDPTDWLSLGLSGFSGKAYPVYAHYGFAMHDMIFNGHTDMTKFVYKNRGAVDAKARLGSRWDLSGEYAFGDDRDEGQTFQVRSYYGRLDYKIIPQKFTAQLQYEYFNDGRGVDIFEGQSYRNTGNFGLGLTYYVTEQSWVRVAWLEDDRGLLRSTNGEPNAPEFMSVGQISLAF